MKKNILFISIALMLFTNSAFAQQNVVKLNLFGVAITNVPLSYERALNENMSAVVTISYLPSRALPKFAIESQDTSAGFGNLKLNGFSISPEFRFYPGSGEAPKGFYIAPYLRYSFYKASTPYYYKETTGVVSKLETAVRFNYYGAGFQIGKHWLIGDKFSIDWSIIGLGYGSFKTAFRVSGDLQDDTYSEVEGEYSTKVKKLGTVTGKVTEDYAEISIAKGMPALRIAFSFGWAF